MGVRMRSLRALAIIALAAAPTAAFGADSPQDAARLEFFEQKIRPILVGHCYTCHSADTNSQGGLRVDDRNGLLTGGRRGPAIVPGNPSESRLIRAVRHTDGKLKMPPESQLTEEQIADLVRWIEQGAAWPQESDWTPVDPGAEYEELRKSHWAWQPLRDRPIPRVQDASWPSNEIDRFLLAQMEERNLTPVVEADKVQLIRRATFDLTGLPPSPGDIQAFVQDDSPQAFERVADRLLDSPAFGERWGRHWLDVARYGESTGSSRNLPYPHAWRYRDYVIRAFNADKPYDQFLREQIAGDLLPAATPEERTEHLIATGFLALGVKDVNQRFKVRFVMDNIDEQIDTVTRSVLALTASCARCHNHKFDPIPQTDYYALAGIFHSTDLCAGLRNKMGGGGLDYYDTDMLIPLEPPSVTSAETAVQFAGKQKELRDAQAALNALQNDPQKDSPDAEERKKQLQAARQTVNRLRSELNDLSDPAMQGSVAIGVRDAQVVADTEIRIRGEAERLGPKVPRGFLSLCEVPDAPSVAAQHSGRLELSQWLTSPHNPLTPRVMVNRVWKHLFGQGLVRSVDNFGVTGDQPSHPELLDHLSVRFVRDGWSVKSLIRSVMLSRAYRLSADASPSQLAADPENRLIWRHSPRRLDAEEIRDSMLFASGRLDRSPISGSPAEKFKVVELPNNGKEAKELAETAATSVRRSIYLPLLRGLVPPSLEEFDFADQGTVTGSRGTTTVAPQALYLLNDSFVRRQAEILANRLLSWQKIDDAERISRAYSQVFGRLPSAAEVEQASHYLVEYADLVGRLSQPQIPNAVGQEEHVEIATGTNDNGESKTAGDAPRTPPPPALPEDPPKNKPAVAKAKPVDPRAAAWASFCQALFGSAEFRYLR